MTVPDLTFRRSSLTWLCYAMLGLYAYGQGAINPLMPLLRRDLDLSYTLGSLHPSAFALGMVTAGLLGDRILLRLGTRTVFWAGSLGMMLGILLLISGAVAPITILGTYVMGAMGSVAIIGMQTSLIVLHRHFSPIALTESNIVASIAASAVPLAVGYFEGSGSTWRWALLIAIGVWLLMFATRWNAPLPEAPIPKRTAQGRLPRVVWLYLATIFLGVSVEWGAWLWAADYLIVNAGVEAATAASLVALFPIGAVTGRVAMSRLLRTRTPQSLMPWMMLFVFVGFPLFYLGQAIWLNGIGLLLMGVGGAGFFPLAIGAVTVAAGPLIGKASARVSLASGSAILVNPPILGFIADNVGIQTSYLIVPVLALATLALILFANRIDHITPSGSQQID